MLSTPAPTPRLLSAALLLSVIGSTVFGQSASGGAVSSPDSYLSLYGVYLAILAVSIAGVGAFVYFRKKASKGAKQLQSTAASHARSPRTRGPKPAMENNTEEITISPVRRNEVATEANTASTLSSKLPVFSFVRLERTRPFLELPESFDEDLLYAIEQTQEGSEEDAEVRALSLKVLAAFKFRSSIDALSQMALYDLSSKLRSAAVTALTDMDHESVFETIVASCADPTREVRAAAARGLFRLGFDRAHAWTRIIESNDMIRMRQAARAATEGGLAERLFERLAHKDSNVAYEAYAVTALLIHAGETEPIFRALAEHSSEEVKLALLHVLQTIKSESTFEALSELLTRHNLPTSVAAKLNEVRSASQMMTA